MPFDLDNTVTFQEWKSCQGILGSLDKILVDLRKYGFSLVTMLLTADGFLFGKAPNVWAIVGISGALLILIAGLFRQDRVHEVFIRGAALRAMALEKALGDELKIHQAGAPIGSLERAGMGSSFEISYWSEKICTGTWGLQLYIGFCAAVGALGAVATATFVPVKCAKTAVDCALSAPTDNHKAMWVVVLISAIAIIWILYNHLTAVSFERHFKGVVNDRADDFGYDRF